MADKETKDDDARDAARPNGDDIKLPSAGAPLPPAMTHRDSHSPMVKAE